MSTTVAEQIVDELHAIRVSRGFPAVAPIDRSERTLGRAAHRPAGCLMSVRSGPNNSLDWLNNNFGVRDNCQIRLRAASRMTWTGLVMPDRVIPYSVGDTTTAAV
jgi:hypothetical protein